jgi:macrolide-specific efflux system membrane fusion protein
VLTDLDTLQVEAGFSEVDAAQVRLGQAVTLSFEALPGQEVGGRVASVDPTSTLVRNVVTYDVTMVLEREVEGVKPGMTTTAEVVVAERSDVVTVPNSAVTGRSGRATVAVLEEGRAVDRQVVLGLRGDDSTEVVSGLSVGDRVVTRTTPPRTSAGLGR